MPAGTTSDEETSLHFRTVHGYRRAFRTAGRGPPLLLLHGIGDNSISWQPVIPALAQSFQVIAPDLLGHGGSDKPRADYSVAAYANGMRDLLDVLDIDRVTVVGHSLGGGVAAQLAYQYPERCDRLVFVATGGLGREVTPILQLLAAPFGEVFLPLSRWPASRLAGWLMLEALRHSNHDLGLDVEQGRRIFDALPDGSARRAFTRTVRSVVDWRGQVVTMLDRSYLAENVPVLLIWGARDGVIPVRHGVRAASAMPGSRLVLFEGAGHFPHHADPVRFVAELQAFIAETQPVRSTPARRRQLLLRGARRPGADPVEPIALT